MKNKKHNYGILVLITAAGMVSASYGMLANVGGLFFKPIAADLGLGIGQVSLTLTISNLLMALGGLASPKLMKPERMKTVILAAAAVLAASTIGLAASSDIYLMYILNGIRGFSAGVVGMVPGTILLNNWYHKRTGTVISIAMGCSGITGALVSPLLSSVIVSHGWRSAYLLAAGLIVLLVLPGIIFPIAFRPEMLGQKAYGDETDTVASSETASGPASEKASGPASAAALSSSAAAAEKNAGIRIRAALVTAVVLYSILGSFLAAFTQHFPVLAADYGCTVMVGSAMLSACMITNTCGKLAFGSLSDRFGTLKLIIADLIIVAVSCLILMNTDPGLLAAGAALYGCCYALSTVGVSLMTKDIFGTDNYAKVFPAANMSGMAANAFATTAIGLLYDLTSDYRIVLAGLTATLAVMLVLAVAAYKSSKAA